MPARPFYFLRFFAVASVLASVSLGSVSLSQAQANVGVRWQTDLDAARNVAQKEGKLLLIHFWSESCGPCRILDATIFNQEQVAKVMAASYVPVKLNANEFPATAKRFGITRVPTDVVITPEGQVLSKSVSPGTPMAYMSQLHGVAQQHQRVTQRLSATSNVASNATPPVNSAYAQLAVPVEASQPEASQLATPAIPQTALSKIAAPSETITNRYATPAATPAIPPVTTPQANRYAAVPALPVASQAAPAAPVMNRYATQPITPITQPQAAFQPAMQPLATNNPYAQVAVSPVMPVAPAVSQQPVAPVQTAVQLPAGSPPLGFQGYCPVTMKSEWKWQLGDSRWGAVHRGRTYLFAGAAQRDLFLKDPDAFSPALSGIDPVLAIDQQQTTPGLRQFSLEYQDQFYMFSSEATLKQFWTNAEKYSSGVRQATNGAAQRTLR